MPLPVINNSEDIETFPIDKLPIIDHGPVLPPFPIFGPINMKNLIFIGALILLIIALIEKRQ